MPQEDDPDEEDPVEEIPKQQNPDEEMPQEEDMEKEDPEEEILEQETWNQKSHNKNSQNKQTHMKKFNFHMNQTVELEVLSNPTIDEILASIAMVDLNRGMGIAEPENPTFVDIFREPENPINAEMLADLPPNKRIRTQENPTIDATFNSWPAINPNRGFTIRDPQNPTNNPAPAAVPEQQDKGKDKDGNPRPTEELKYSPECFLFPRTTSEEEDDIVTMKFVSAYRRNQWPLPSAGSPEHFDTLFAFISSQLPLGESISLETLKEKFAKLMKKYGEAFETER